MIPFVCLFEPKCDISPVLSNIQMIPSLFEPVPFSVKMELEKFLVKTSTISHYSVIDGGSKE